MSSVSAILIMKEKTDSHKLFSYLYNAHGPTDTEYKTHMDMSR